MQMNATIIGIAIAVIVASAAGSMLLNLANQIETAIRNCGL